MIKKYAILTALLLAMTFFITGCKSGNGPADGTSGSEQTSGQSEDKLAAQAEKYVRDYLSGNSFSVTVGGETAVIDPWEAGASFDKSAVDSYILSAGGDAAAVEKYIAGLAGERTADREYIDNIVAGLAAGIDKGRDFTYEIGEAGITVYRGLPHTKIDASELASRIAAALDSFDYSDISADAQTVPAAYPDMEKMTAEAVTEPQNARYDLEYFTSAQPGDTVQATRTVLVPEVPGRGFDYDAMMNGIENETWESKTYPFVETLPEITSENINQNYFKDLLGSYKTTYDTSNANRTTNILIASEAMNGTIVLPGEKFSFNDTVGERTKDKGYKEATIFTPNGSEPGLGGGICQLVSTTYAASLHAGLKQVQRYNHGYAVSYITLGIDATVAYPYFDYRFRNDTPDPVKIVVSNSNGTLTVEIYGTQTVQNRTIKFKHNTVEILEPEKEYVTDATLQPGQQVSQRFTYGYVIETYMTTIVDGQEISKVLLHTDKYNPNPKKITVRVGPEATAETTIPETSESFPQD